MARQGFLSRIRSAVRRALHREEKPSGPPPSPPTPPTPPPAPTGGNDWREIWDAYRDEMKPKYRRRYRRVREMFLNFEYGLNLDDPDEQLEDWSYFVRYMVAGDSPYRRNDPRNPFWQHMGTDPGDFDWDAWRVAMGYTSRAR